MQDLPQPVGFPVLVPGLPVILFDRRHLGHVIPRSLLTRRNAGYPVLASRRTRPGRRHRWSMVKRLFLGHFCVAWQDLKSQKEEVVTA